MRSTLRYVWITLAAGAFVAMAPSRNTLTARAGTLTMTITESSPAEPRSQRHPFRRTSRYVKALLSAKLAIMAIKVAMAWLCVKPTFNPLNKNVRANR